MTSASATIGAVLLAAGNASRFGAPKQLLMLDGEPMVRRMAMAAVAAVLSPVVVVTGAYHEQVLASLGDLDVQVIEHRDWSSGMGGSLAAGVRAIAEQAPSLTSVMLLLADQPSIDATDLARMLKAHARRPDRILAARYDGHLGPPCLFPRFCFDELAALHGTHGARALLDTYAERVDAHDLPAAAFDIDTPADHARWLARYRLEQPDR
ncbi:nucleotidyltransferase family protein [Dyella jiangningensis]|uniref:MobA-like NTP transferase domain-containing protein n=1 Tax=Dyella jiangningensis TaxID=1379159 RepID=A0A328P6W1_9GAMM|nr:nucleotidyltransferase family protein [Dyella jiangningensis]RAO76295.1 hypothetical protein CA260_11455 [Dyella jiangningensis]